ncbi:MAG: HAD-IIIA family hydrolase [Clostridiales Family XIII bacterium]|jgi:D-glycero-D-manno-heptose 1,7-bisphosphate phosphatase|nr:HAD-IIIA family hydrolase [Clostridiales Family XIII bacterium]
MRSDLAAVIMAGGKGTRIASVHADIPKPMILVCGKPILEHQIECLRKQGIRNIFLSIGHLGHIIRDYFGDGSGLSPVTQEPFGVTIRYISEREPLGTAGALYYLKPHIQGDFLLINGDLIFDVDFERFFRQHQESGADATIFVHPNDHPFDSGIIITDEDLYVTKWLHKEDDRLWYQNRVNAGLHFLSAEVLDRFETPVKKDLDRDILMPLIALESLHAYASPEYVKDIGTPQRLAEVEHDMAQGKIAAKNLKKKQRAVFLDRDGTINRYVGFLRNIEEFELIEGIAEAIKKINQSGYLAIVVTNQPVIARGEVSWAQLHEIHNKMETLLGESGAFVDDILICPHHPNKGFAGERPEYKIACNCRKPKPGLLLEAAEQYNIDLSASWMVGDADTDIEAGLAAGCKVALISEVLDEKREDIATYSNLLGFASEQFDKI